MFYLYFIFQVLLLLLLLPIRLLINFIVRFLWEDFKFDPSLFVREANKPIQEYAQEVKSRLINNLNKMSEYGDSAKFISMLLVATNDMKVYEIFKSYIKDGKFYRKMNIKTKKAFSGDMFAGYSYALLNLHYRRILDEDKKFKQEVINVLENSLFKSPYLQLKTYSYTNDRGYLLRWFFVNAGHFLPILTLLHLLHKFTKDSKYNIMYKILFPIAFFDILTNPTFVIRKGKFRYMQWYYVHSNFLYYYTLYKSTGNWIYKYALKFIYKRFYFNPEFSALLGFSYIPKLYLYDYTNGSINEYKNFKCKTIKVKNIKDILRMRPAEYEECDTIVPPRVRKNDYQWEKTLVNKEWKLTHLAGVDFLHLYYLYRGQVV